MSSISERLGRWGQSMRGFVSRKRDFRARRSLMHRPSPRLESLEARSLLSTTLLRFPVSSGPGYTDNVTSTAVGSDGNVWFTDDVSSSGTPAVRIGKVTPQGAVTLYAQVPGFQSYQIVAGPDGNLWFNQLALSGGTNAMTKITTSGVMTAYPLGVASGYTLTSGPNESLWFSTTDLIGRAQLNRLTTNGILTTTTIAVSNSDYSAIEHMTASADGQFQVTGLSFPPQSYNQVYWVGQLTAAGVLTIYTPTLTVRGTGQAVPLYASGITIGPDGNPWYTFAGLTPQNPPKAIGRMVSPGVFRVTPLRIPASVFPQQIVSGSNALYFSLVKNTVNGPSIRAVIGRVTPAGKVFYVQLPRVKDASGVATMLGASAFTVAPDKNLWFAGKLGTGGAEIVRIKLCGGK